MKRLALLFRERREQVFGRWHEALKDAVVADYREVLESPIGLRIVGTLIEEMVNLSQAELYEVPAIWRQVEEVTADEAGRRARLGFELDDILAGRFALRVALWRIVADAIVTGELPPAGETMDEMSEVDQYLDRLVRAEVRGYLAYTQSIDDD
jgi:hypothetical protein